MLIIAILWILILSAVAVCIHIKIARIIARMVSFSGGPDIPEYILGGIVVYACLFIVLFLSVPSFLCVTNGFYKDYSTGERLGCITKISQKGLIWKTWEGELQTVSGDVAVPGLVFLFSVPDPEVLEEVRDRIGQKVRIQYTEWLLQPYRRGSSGYEIVKVQLEPVK